MKMLFAIVMGLFSGLLLYFMVGLVTISPTRSLQSSASLVLVMLVGGWIFSTWLLVRGARSANAVLRRGFLLGAAEWLLMALCGVVYSARAVGSVVSQGNGSEGTLAGAAIGAGFVSLLTGGVSVFMAVICLIAFAVAFLSGREMRDTTSPATRRCPECAEMIQPEARKCRYCGSSVTPESAVPKTAGTRALL